MKDFENENEISMWKAWCTMLTLTFDLHSGTEETHQADSCGVQPHLSRSGSGWWQRDCHLHETFTQSQEGPQGKLNQVLKINKNCKKFKKINLSLHCTYKHGRFSTIQCYYNIISLQEKNRTNETEMAKMEKLINFVREPLLEKEEEKMD